MEADLVSWSDPDKHVVLLMTVRLQRLLRRTEGIAAGCGSLFEAGAEPLYAVL
jgi:hypothetical protein